MRKNFEKYYNQHDLIIQLMCDVVSFSLGVLIASLFLVFASYAFAMSPVVATQPSPTTFCSSTAGYEMAAQSFQPEFLNINSLGFSLDWGGAVIIPVLIAVQADSSGVPSGGDLFSFTGDFNQTMDYRSWIEIPFVGTLPSFGQYWLVFSCPSGTHATNVRYLDHNAYTDSYVSGASYRWSGIGLVAAGYDFNFQIGYDEQLETVDTDTRNIFLGWVVFFSTFIFIVWVFKRS